jgi:hypothetical protein
VRYISNRELWLESSDAADHNAFGDFHAVERPSHVPGNRIGDGQLAFSERTSSEEKDIIEENTGHGGKDSGVLLGARAPVAFSPNFGLHFMLTRDRKLWVQ